MKNKIWLIIAITVSAVVIIMIVLSLEKSVPIFETTTTTKEVIGGGTLPICGNLITDTRDGKTYTTVQIGTQCWFAENLDYDNGCTTKIWEDNTDIGWCGYYTGGPYEKEGLLYQRSVVMASDLCPIGWHIPTHDEFYDLARQICSDNGNLNCDKKFSEDALIIDSHGTDEGDSLKIASNCKSGVHCGTSGFNALLAGYRGERGEFVWRGRGVGYWENTNALYWQSSYVWTLKDDESNFYSTYAIWKEAMSVRCLKD